MAQPYAGSKPALSNLDCRMSVTTYLQSSTGQAWGCVGACGPHEPRLHPFFFGDKGCRRRVSQPWVGYSEWPRIEDRSLVLRTIKQALEKGDDYRVTYRILKPDGEVRWMEASGKVVGMPPTKLAGVCMDITERKHDEERIHNLMREVNHRSKNLLSLVQSVAKFTAAPSQADFLERFSERLRGLAASQDLLVDRGWRGIDIAALAFSQLAVFADLIGTRIEANGPSVRLAPSAAQSIGMALHELATNAGKYGALSTPLGKVQLRWAILHADSPEPQLEVVWAESDGPRVEPPDRKGFGHTVIGSVAKSGSSGTVEYNFEPTGVTWRLLCPAAAVLKSKSTDLTDGCSPTGR